MSSAPRVAGAMRKLSRALLEGVGAQVECALCQLVREQLVQAPVGFCRAVGVQAAGEEVDGLGIPAELAEVEFRHEPGGGSQDLGFLVGVGLLAVHVVDPREDHLAQQRDREAVARVDPGAGVVLGRPACHGHQVRGDCPDHLVQPPDRDPLVAVGVALAEPVVLQEELAPAGRERQPVPVLGERARVAVGLVGGEPDGIEGGHEVSRCVIAAGSASGAGKSRDRAA